MRIDKFFSTLGLLSRSESKAELKKNSVQVNGQTVKSGDYKVDPLKDVITFHGNLIRYSEYVYVMLNKPKGVVSATEDRNTPTVLDLLPDNLKKLNLFPCGRLDKDTEGLVILTNDGISAHNALSPKKHVTKKYLFTVADEYTNDDIQRIESGITLKDGYTTKPCKIERIDTYKGYIYLTEGKYHEIKRLFGACGNKITQLKRISFSDITLGDLPEGDWRVLTDEEIKIFTQKS